MTDPKLLPVIQAVKEYAAENDEDSWCQRLKYGKCSIRKCNVEGGWTPGNPADYSLATCARYRLECALSSTRPDPEAVPENKWRDYMSGAALSFEPGVLNIKRDGSGSFAFRESVLDWEQDDGGPCYLVANIPVGELFAIRDYLNEWFPPALSSTRRDERVDALGTVLEEARGIVARYRRETPPGHQPHMICHKADELLSNIDAALQLIGKA